MNIFNDFRDVLTNTVLAVWNSDFTYEVLFNVYKIGWWQIVERV